MNRRRMSISRATLTARVNLARAKMRPPQDMVAARVWTADLGALFESLWRINFGESVVNQPRCSRAERELRRVIFRCWCPQFDALVEAARRQRPMPGCDYQRHGYRLLKIADSGPDPKAGAYAARIKRIRLKV